MPEVREETRISIRIFVLKLVSLSRSVQEENLHDVMELLLALVFEDPHHIVVKMLEDLDGLK